MSGQGYKTRVWLVRHRHHRESPKRVVWSAGSMFDSNIMIEHFSAVPSPHTLMGFQQLGNAANRVSGDATAFSHRDALYDFLMLSAWEDPAEAERNVQCTRALDTAIQPCLHGGIYVNAFTEDSKQELRDAYRPETYARLVALKNKYDPTNFFRINPNIQPTA